MSPPTEAEEQNLTGLWMVPYADLMSTLVILFLALFAYAYIRKGPEYDRALAHLQAELSPEDEARFAKSRLKETELAVEIKEKLKQLTLEEFGVLVTSKRVLLTLPAPMLFAEGSDELSPQARGVLEALARLLSQVSNPVLVEGHTDNIPISRSRHRTNWELSAARSFAVIEYFIAKGLPASRFHARGYGEFRPVASNASPEGRRLNRRIEISLIREARLDQ